MITLANTLKVTDIVIDLAASNMPAATAELLNILRHDKRITNWAKFVDAMSANDICVEGAAGTNFCIPHARSNAVQSLVIAAGRRRSGISIGPGGSETCHYVFVIGIPAAMDADYLRLIGTVARIFHREDSVKALNAAESAADFHQALASAEKHL